jgi:hypothetical protein
MLGVFLVLFELSFCFVFLGGGNGGRGSGQGLEIVGSQVGFGTGLLGVVRVGVLQDFL